MKRLAILALTASGLFAADFVTGQAARAVIGQPDFSAELPGPDDTFPGNKILGAVSGVAYANGLLVVADSSVFRVGADPQNNRVLLFPDITQQIPGPTAQVPQTTDTNWWCPLCGGTASVVLGQADFTATDPGATASTMHTPTAVATDGVHLAVADTDNNRVLIWNTIPQSSATPADLVLGQPDFTSFAPNNGTGNVLVPSAHSLRGPQGVWIQNGKLFVADDMNNRVLIWNQFPASNNQDADVVLGQPDFTTQTEGDLTKASPDATATNMLNPTAVTSDGTRLFVTDLGHNRVMIWNTIPTQNQVAADVVVGQPSKTTNLANYTGSGGVCESNGTDTSGNPTYPPLCGATLSFPRFALSDGTRLFISDGGNDRILVFNSIPAQDGAKADAVLGQVDDTSVQTSDDTTADASTRRASADSIRTPCALAWDGTNLYAAEPFSRRVLVFTAGSSSSLAHVVNAASMQVFAIGTIAVGGTINAGDVGTVTIAGTDYKYTVKSGDTLATISTSIADLINAGDGDPNVLAMAIPTVAAVILSARKGGTDGNNIVVSVTTSINASLALSGGTMSGGGDAAKLAGGSLVSIFGTNLSDQDPVGAPAGANPLPGDLGGVQVYADGVRMPLLYTSSTQINAQLPFEVAFSGTASLYVRITHSDGSVTAGVPVAVPIILANPGIFAFYGIPEPRPAVAVHSSSFATGAVDLELTATAPKDGDTVTITIADRPYTYTTHSTDTLDTVRDALVQMISSQDPDVDATAGGQFDRVLLHARTPGPAGEGITYSGSYSTNSNVTAGGYSDALCCANVAGALVTSDNPAVPSETITVYATGLGAVTPNDTVKTGYIYTGPFQNKPADPTQFVSSLIDGVTAFVLNCGLLPGTVGLYQVDLMLSADQKTNPFATVTIAQSVRVSNVVTIAVQNPSTQ